jgi:hypothetical protein
MDAHMRASETEPSHATDWRADGRQRERTRAAGVGLQAGFSSRYDRGLAQGGGTGTARSTVAKAERGEIGRSADTSERVLAILGSGTPTMPEIRTGECPLAQRTRHSVAVRRCDIGHVDIRRDPEQQHRHV